LATRSLNAIISTTESGRSPRTVRPDIFEAARMIPVVEE
jgi:hypothetical protein